MIQRFKNWLIVKLGGWTTESVAKFRLDRELGFNDGFYYAEVYHRIPKTKRAKVASKVKRKSN